MQGMRLYEWQAGLRLPQLEGFLGVSVVLYFLPEFPWPKTRDVSAVASNRPTEALASVISVTFVVYSHYKHS